ncbi:MAG TPA: hypothetical protein PKW08_08950 [Flavobacteriaceae bacterium]|nr:hypothetical protein [Flavobacteriaceae bacterium]MCB9213831.1 hypothetical protein [Alteromonas sp.]HPF11227.1 hypothetical protein [Flavobacteriaceae bacterium]HQU21706.1 hypothetical protein [Flavobacteriaceae bacterium]HQU64554.1 hypothetical protein [Flavobacteriaceae bacterium]
MQQTHIDLKQRRDLGSIISVYFDFFKMNLKPFLNTFIQYNGFFVLGFLGISYMMVTGFVGLFRSRYPYNETYSSGNESLLWLGFLGFILLLIVTGILNYSLAASYTIRYEEHPEELPSKKSVWALVSKNLGGIFLFVVLMILLYIPVIIVSVIVSIIPVVGMLGQYIISLGFTAWMGISFAAMLHQGKSVTDALGEGWRLIGKGFWKSILANLVISFLLFLLLMVVLMVPGIIIGIYAYFSLESGVDLSESPFATVVWTLALSILLLLFAFNQSLSQFINSILYYNLYEEMYNEAARKRIEQIGVSE